MAFIFALLTIISGLVLCFEIHPAFGCLVLFGGLTWLTVLIKSMSYIAEQEKIEAARITKSNLAQAAKAEAEAKASKEDPKRFMPGESA